MRFTFSSTFYRVVDALSSRVATLEQDLFALSFKPFATLAIATLVFCSNSSTQNETFAQNALSSARSSASSRSIQSPEEASGTSIKDFDALHALSSDFIANPDGKEVPVDEDDAWLPDLSLAKKSSTPASSQEVRVISYGEKGTTSEVRNYAPAPNAPTKVAQTSSNVSGSAQQTTSQTKTKSAAYAAPSSNQAQQSVIRQTQATTPATQSQGFADYSSEGFNGYAANAQLSSATSSAGQGFEGYDPNAVTTVSEPLQTESASISTPQYASIAPQESAVAPTDDAFPTATLDYSAVGAPAAQATAPEVPNYSSAPIATSQAPVVDSFPSVSPTTQLNDQNGTSIAPSQNEIKEEEQPFHESYVATPQDSTLSYGEEETPKTDLKSEAKRDSKEVPLESAQLSESDLKNLTIEDVRISGLEMTAQQFNKIVKTRIGAKFNQQRLEEDKRSLLQTKQFIDVAVSTSWTPDKPDKVIVNFDLTPRRLMRYIKVVGNKKLSKHEILEELGLKPGESRMDPYEVENGRLRIIEFYKSKDYAEPYVEILRGDRPEDVGVVYLIDEGVSQHVLKTTFVGNTIVSGARLRSLISVKPGFMFLIGGKFTRDRLDADVEKLLEYYRQLGYFDARIDREYEEGSGFAGLGRDDAWVTVRYIIDEGPRYKIRNFTFNGNRVLKTAELEKKLKVKRGTYYNYYDVETDRVALRCEYQDQGYVRADVTPNLVFTDEVGVLDIRYDIKEDHRYRVRDVIVDYVGTESRTMTPVVLNMLDLTPGELLNGVKIRQSENTLRQSGYFNDKASEGQIPEIAVVPDESSVYSIEQRGGAKIIKEARRPEKEDGDKEDDKSRDKKTTRGQAKPAKQSTPRVTRGQTSKTNGPYSAGYVPYEQSRQAQESSASQSQGFLSYGPSASSVGASESAASSKTAVAAKAPYVSPVCPFTSIMRGQTTIPSGFSSTTTRANANGDSGYRGYDTGSYSDSQYGGSGEYANSTTTDADSDNGPAGFSGGVYNSVGEDVLEPITPETDDIYNGDVLIKLQEGRTGMFTASVGVNSDYGLVGNVSFTERNFNLFRPPTNFFTCDGWKDAFRGGGQILNVQASPGTTVQSYRVSWDVPYVFHTKNTFGITGLYGDHDYDEWFESRYGGEIRLGRQWTPRFSTTLSGGAYRVKISDPQVTFVPDLNDAVGSHSEYTIGLSAAYDTRNHPYTPSEGYLVKGTAEEVLGSYQFPRVSLAGRYYKTLHKRIDGSGRWVLGLYSNAGWNGSDAPIYERYYGGGSTSIRGFDYRGVTPRYKQTGFGIGGNFEFYNTAELLVPVSGGDEFQFAVFVDSGTVATDIKNWGRYRVAPGLGLRISIPMLGPAPLALDFAFPINKSPDDDTEVFSFSMSGSR